MYSELLALVTDEVLLDRTASLTSALGDVTLSAASTVPAILGAETKNVSIWDSANPSLSGESNEAAWVNVGVKFSINVNALISGVRIWSTSLLPDNIPAHLWDETGSLIASTTIHFVDGFPQLIPAYFDLSQSAGVTSWQTMVDGLVTAGIPSIIIANPASGPSTAALSYYTTAIGVAKAAGQRVVGYVDTNFGTRSIVDVKLDIERWFTFYPTIDGIFFDRVATDPSATATGCDGSCTIQSGFYGNIYYHVKSFSSTAVVIANPGASTSTPWLISTPAANIVVNFQGDVTAYTAWSPSTWETQYDKSVFCNLIYGASIFDLDLVRRKAGTTNAGSIYITDRTLAANPWLDLSIHFPPAPATGSAAGWKTGHFSSRVPIPQNTEYTVSYLTYGFYPYTAPYFGGTLTWGRITTAVSAGRFNYSAIPSYPSTSYNTGNYWVDPIIDIGSGPIVLDNTTISASGGSAFVQGVFQTLQDVSGSIAADVNTTASVTKTLDGPTPNAIGLNNASTTLTKTLDSVAFSSTAKAIAGVSRSGSLANVTITSALNVRTGVSLSKTLGNVSYSIVSGSSAAPRLTATLAGPTLSFAALQQAPVSTPLTLAATLGNEALSFAATSRATASLTKALGSASLASSAKAISGVSLTKTLGNTSINSTLTASALGSALVIQTLEPVAISAVAGAVAGASLSLTTASVTKQVLAGSVARVSASLVPSATLSSFARVGATVGVAGTLAPVNLQAFNRVRVRPSFSAFSQAVSLTFNARSSARLTSHFVVEPVSLSFGTGLGSDFALSKTLQPVQLTSAVRSGADVKLTKTLQSVLKTITGILREPARIGTATFLLQPTLVSSSANARARINAAITLANVSVNAYAEEVRYLGVSKTLDGSSLSSDVDVASVASVDLVLGNTASSSLATSPVTASLTSALGDTIAVAGWRDVLAELLPREVTLVAEANTRVTVRVTITLASCGNVLRARASQVWQGSQLASLLPMIEAAIDSGFAALGQDATYISKAGVAVEIQIVPDHELAMSLGSSVSLSSRGRAKHFVPSGTSGTQMFAPNLVVFARQADFISVVPETGDAVLFESRRFRIIGAVRDHPDSSMWRISLATAA